MKPAVFASRFKSRSDQVKMYCAMFVKFIKLFVKCLCDGTDSQEDENNFWEPTANERSSPQYNALFVCVVLLRREFERTRGMVNVMEAPLRAATKHFAKSTSFSYMHVTLQFAMDRHNARLTAIVSCWRSCDVIYTGPTSYLRSFSHGPLAADYNAKAAVDTF